MKKSSYKWIAAALGAAGGFAYWKFVGCESGGCPIQSTWYISTLFGLVIGWLIGRIISGESGCGCHTGSSASSCGCGSGSAKPESEAPKDTPKSGCGCGCN
ncbi:MAG: DUF6132 family protein [Bacteroidales bacterium]